jgi:hypothetical protein
VTRITSPAESLSVLALAALMVAPGCLSSADRANPPLRLSREDLVTEQSLTHGELLKQIRITSIAGSNQFAVPGALYHYPVVPSFSFPGQSSTPRSPAQAIGLARDKSFVLIGESQLNHGVFVNACDLFTDVRAAAEDMAALGELIARSALSSRDRVGSDLPSSLLDRVGPTRAALQAARKKLETFLDQHPGILILNWSADDSRSARLSAAPLGRIAQSDRRRREGFAVLGGVRLQATHVGQDLKQWLLERSILERGNVEHLGITTMILQSRWIRYDSSTDRARLLAVTAELDRVADTPALADLRLSLRFAASTLESIGNCGSVGPMHWTSAELDMYDPPAELGWVKASVELRSAAEASDGWITVDAIITRLSDLDRIWTGSGRRAELPQIPCVASPAWSRLAPPDDLVAKEVRDNVEALNDEIIALNVRIGTESFQHNVPLVALALDRCRDILTRHNESAQMCLLARAPDEINRLVGRVKDDFQIVNGILSLQNEGALALSQSRADSPDESSNREEGGDALQNGRAAAAESESPQAKYFPWHNPRVVKQLLKAILEAEHRMTVLAIEMEVDARRANARTASPAPSAATSHTRSPASPAAPSP